MTQTQYTIFGLLLLALLVFGIVVIWIQRARLAAAPVMSVEMFLASTQRNLSYLWLVGFFVVVILNGLKVIDLDINFLAAATMLVLGFWYQRERGSKPDGIPPGSTGRKEITEKTTIDTAGTPEPVITEAQQIELANALAERGFNADVASAWLRLKAQGLGFPRVIDIPASLFDQIKTEIATATPPDEEKL